jgi:hypothetical protein
MGSGRARARPCGLRAVIRAERNARKGAKPMRTRAKGASVGPVTVIVAASSRWPGARSWRQKRKEGLSRRSVTRVSSAVTRAGRLVRQLERAGIMLGAVATGLELVRELRIAGSNGTPSGGHRSQRSVARGSSPYPSGRASRPGSSTGGTQSAPKSPSRSTKKRPAKRTNTKKKTRGASTRATKRSRSRATKKKAGRARTNGKTQARSRASAKRTRSSGRSRSSPRS